MGKKLWLLPVGEIGTYRAALPKSNYRSMQYFPSLSKFILLKVNGDFFIFLYFIFIFLPMIAKTFATFFFFFHFFLSFISQLPWILYMRGSRTRVSSSLDRRSISVTLHHHRVTARSGPYSLTPSLLLAPPTARLMRFVSSRLLGQASGHAPELMYS